MEEQRQEVMFLTIESMPIPALLIDEAGEVRYISARCKQLIGSENLTWFNLELEKLAAVESAWQVKHLLSPSAKRLMLHRGDHTQNGYVVLVFENESRFGANEAEGLGYPVPARVFEALPDQGEFLQMLQASVRSSDNSVGRHNQDELALYCVGLTGLRAINDADGYRYVDRLLELFIERLQGSPLVIEILGRLGSGEFLLLLSLCAKDSKSACNSYWENQAEQILDLATRPYLIEYKTFTPGCHVGFTTMDQYVKSPGKSVDTGSQGLFIEAQDCEKLIQQSLTARHGAMRKTHNGYLEYNETLAQQLSMQRELENDLRRAVVLEEFELYFQPKVNMESLQIIGFEALIRWRHTKRGIVSPLEFIPMAESTDLIVPLGRWVIEESCRRVACWPSELSIAINLSPKQFADAALVSTVQNAIVSNGLQPQQVELEITESAILNDNDAAGNVSAQEQLQALKSLGVSIAIDDFGTGYSALQYLVKYPFDTLKIDQSFVRDESSEVSNAIIRGAVVALSRKLDLTIVAEGIETQDQLERLQAESWDIAQGYYFSKPVPFLETFTLINDFNKLNLRVPEKSAGTSHLEKVESIDCGNEYLVDNEEILRLVYISSHTMGDGERLSVAIEQIMAASTSNNASLGITGALMFNNNVFAQILEGPGEAVEKTFERIQRDPRHAEIVVLDCYLANSRAFPHWAMAFVGQQQDKQTAFREVATLTDFSDKPLMSDRVMSALKSLVYRRSIGTNGSSPANDPDKGSDDKQAA